MFIFRDHLLNKTNKNWSRTNHSLSFKFIFFILIYCWLSPLVFINEMKNCWLSAFPRMISPMVLIVYNSINWIPSLFQSDILQLKHPMEWSKVWAWHIDDEEDLERESILIYAISSWISLPHWWIDRWQERIFWLALVGETNVRITLMMNQSFSRYFLQRIFTCNRSWIFLIFCEFQCLSPREFNSKNWTNLRMKELSRK